MGPGGEICLSRQDDILLVKLCDPFFVVCGGEEERRESGVWGERLVFISTGRSSPAIHIRAANAAGFKDKLRQPAASSLAVFATRIT
jgi:hypothetical protein